MTKLIVADAGADRAPGDGYGRLMRRIRAVLLDIDGVLTVSWRPVPGAVEALARLRAGGYAIALVTNTTSRDRAWMAATLAEAGFGVEAAEIFTAPAITAAYLARNHPGARCALLNSGEVGSDLAGVRIIAQDEPAPDVVILGGAGPEFSYPALNRVFGYLLGGARLVAMGRNLYWRTESGLQLDTGAFLAGLEQAAGVRAEVTGKPAAAFFATALAALDAEPSAAVMAGDDVEADVLGAQRHGLTGVLVRTGKYRPETLRDAPGAPDHVIDSVADLPGLLERLAAESA
jgi:HAD superfamily hydrolase (TIGR01458 family)